MNIKIDPEFHGLIPKISDEELKGLEESLLNEGCRDPLVLWDDILLDGHNRYEICQKHEIKFKTISKGFDDRDQAKLWIIKNQFFRRNLNDFQRAELALKLKPLLAAEAKERMLSGKKDPTQKFAEGKETRQEIAAMAGVSRENIRKVEFILENAPKEKVEKVRKGEKGTSINRTFKEVKTEKRKERILDREKKAEKPKSDAKFKLYVSELDHLDLTENSVDAIITDPPYGKEYLPLYKSLSLLASKVLKNGSPCLVMVGQSHLEEVLHNLSTNLLYQWMLAYFTPGSSVQVFGRKIKSNWKPIIFLTNGKNEWEHIDDVIWSDKEDKEHHKLGQSVTGMISLIEKFTTKNQVILDPFCGAGTTGVACLLRDRYFIGSDISEDEIEKTKKRLISI